MSRLVVRANGPLRGSTSVRGDKSISHRALLLGGLADGVSRFTGFLPSADCLATLGCIRALGVAVEREDETTLTVHGRGPRALEAPSAPLDCVRSGTTIRLLAGILAGQPFASTLTGDPQLLRRPMRRVVAPLRQMGAEIDDVDGCAPLQIAGRRLRGYDHHLAIASAQVKSALLLAGLNADGPTIVRQPGPARDHTERMLAAMGADLFTEELVVTLSPGGPLAPLHIDIPGDLSSAAFFLVAATLVPASELTIAGVGINPTRTGLLDVLQTMRADIRLENRREQGHEPVADLTVRTAKLQAARVKGETVVRMIDEFPALAVAATQAHGTTLVSDASELRVKETDRIATVVAELQKMGARIEALPDGFRVDGPSALRGTTVDSHGDHRLAMALAVAGLVASGETRVEDSGCIADSFPGFEATLARLSQFASQESA